MQLFQRKINYGNTLRRSDNSLFCALVNNYSLAQHPNTAKKKNKQINRETTETKQHLIDDYTQLRHMLRITLASRTCLKQQKQFFLYKIKFGRNINDILKPLILCVKIKSVKLNLKLETTLVSLIWIRLYADTGSFWSLLEVTCELYWWLVAAIQTTLKSNYLNRLSR